MTGYAYEIQDMNAEPPLQRKKRVDGFTMSKSSMEPPLQRKKRSDSASPIRQVMEPELQRKKKPIPYKKTAPIATELSSAGKQRDDYMLLGDQSKFNENVKYRIRSRSANGNDGSQERRHQRLDKIVSRLNPSGDAPQRVRSHNRQHSPAPARDAPRGERQSRSKERGPPPRVVVDTGKPKTATGKGDSGLKLDLAKELSPSRKVAEERGGHDRVIVGHHHKGILRKSAAMQSTPRVTGGAQSEDVSNGLPLQKRETKGTSGVPLKPSKDESQTTEKGRHVEEQPLKKPDEKRGADKESKAANQERAAGPHHAIKYRLGIAPHRSTGPIRFSEYQKEFQWRDPIKSSPLISAETLVYKSHPDLTLFRSSSMADDSEYKAQFKAWATPHSEENPTKKNDVVSQQNHSTDQPKKPKIRRSKSLKEFPTRHKSDVDASNAAVDVSAEVKERASDDAPVTHDGQPKKKYRSEYSRNFVAPWNYLYDEGAWKKVHAKEDGEAEVVQRPATAPAAAAAASAASAWYAEVLELRRFADEYRKRAQGTHFSREHLAQLFAKNAELWDTVSSSSSRSMVSSLQSTDDPKGSQPDTSVPKRRFAEKTQKKFGSKSTPMLVAKEEISARSGSITPNGSAYSEAEKENALPAAKTVQQWKRPHVAQTTHSALGGRGRGDWAKDYKASHSDNDDSSRDYDSDPDDVSSQYSEAGGYGHGSKVTKVKGRVNQVVSSKEKTRKQFKTNQQKSSVGRSVPMTIASHGLPTRDTHVLVDVNHQDGYHGNSKTTHSPAVMEFEDKAIQIQEEDLMSVTSSRSLASSCSLASEVLERARNRRDEFWT